ncbi:MAG: hypothetical protein I3273_01065 [Candidatus Moeniiplasma glomeromycotorum]|nr:hypothetical protein [Candidatus Moeniiplasma glomeromycotorum]MCE8167288.1 hypothetical protein [Candidatus Moeniiplasma glomeromycotorum]MCE8168699.1 hypothetical protein [Candidatus Moeniiplasma glomeromycotorum]
MSELFRLEKEEFSKTYEEYQWTYQCLFRFTFNYRYIQKITITDHSWKKEGREWITRELILNILKKHLNGELRRPKGRYGQREVFVEEKVPYQNRNTPENIRNIIEQCWKDNPSERISLERIIEMIENDAKANSPTAYINSIESLKLSETQDSQKIDSQLNKFSHSLVFNSEEMGKILNEQKILSTLLPNQEINFKKNLQETEIRLQKLINSAKGKLKSKSKFSDARQRRNEELEKVFQILPAASEELIRKLESIKKDLSEKLTDEEINSLCQVKSELENFKKQEQVAQIEKPPK